VCAESLATSDHTADGTLDDLEARRPNPMKKGGWLKISSHVGADAQAQAELAVAKDRKRRSLTIEVPTQPPATVLGDTLPSLEAGAWSRPSSSP